MNLRDLLILYAVVGVACAIAAWRREAATGWRAASVGSAVATVLVWPLWAPFVLTREAPHARPAGAAIPADPPEGEPHESAPLARIRAALEASVKAVEGTSMSEVFSSRVADRIAAEVQVVAGRLAELSALVDSRGLERDRTEARLQALKAEGAPERTVATARQKHESLARLEQLRAADAVALEELADLLEALRAQLLVARYSGSAADGTEAIVNEVWARLEGLGGAFGAPD